MEQTERTSLTRATEAFEAFMDDVEERYPESHALEGLAKEWRKFHAVLRNTLDLHPDAYPKWLMLCCWYTAQRSLMTCACCGVIPDSLAYPPPLRPEFEQQMTGDDFLKLKDLLHELVERSNTVRSRAVIDLSAGHYAQEPSPSEDYFHDLSAKITVHGTEDIGIKYELQGTRCDDSLQTQRLRFGFDFELRGEVDSDRATVVPSGTSLALDRLGEILETTSDDGEDSLIGDAAKRFLLSTFRAAWTTFNSSERPDNSIFFNFAFPDDLVNGAASVTEAERYLIAALKKWLVLQHR